MSVCDCNSILTIEMKNRSDKGIIIAFTFLTEDFKSWGIHPGFHFMYNKAYTALKLIMTTKNLKYQLVPPSNHRENNAERLIQTFKNHFVAGLCSVEKYFHFQLWYRLLHQATISINLLSKSITLTYISDYTPIFGEFDFNCTHLSPPGTRVVMHNRPNNRT